MTEKHEPFQTTLPSISESNWTITDIYISCPECKKVFENEHDLQDHKERVHEYRELFQIYLCEECGFRCNDSLSLKEYKEEQHASNSVCPEKSTINEESDYFCHVFSLAVIHQPIRHILCIEV